MNKQKAAAPNDPSIKTPKMRKIATPNCSQTQPLSQLINSTQVNPAPLFDGNLEQLTQIWNSAKKNELPMTQDPVRVQLKEIKDELAQANLEIEKLQKSLSNDKKENEKVSRIIEDRCKRRNEIIESQNLIADFDSHIQDHFDVVEDTNNDCQESIEHFAQLYNNISLKQKEIIKNLTEQLNDQISKREKKLKYELESKSAELVTIEAELTNFMKEINETAQLRDEISNKIENSKVILDENKKRYDQEIAQILEINDEKESTLKAEREEKHKLVEEVIENSTMKNEKLIAKYKALLITESEYEDQISILTSNVLELKEEGTGLNNELEELKNIHLTLLSNKDLELAEYSKQIQDLTSICKDATDKLEEVITNSEELSKTAAKMVEDNEQLEELLKNEDDEITNIRTNLNDISNKNKEIDEKMATQNEELIIVEKQISDNTEICKTRSAKQNETAKKKDEIVAELNLIDKQLSIESAEIARLIQEKGDRKVKLAERGKQLKREIKEKNDLITREEETIADLKREMGRKQSQYQKKLQAATHTSKQCQLAGHEKRIKEQNNKMDILNRELSSEKLKVKEANAKKAAIEAKEKEQNENKLKTMESEYRHLNEKLSAMKAEYDVLQKTSGESKNESETISLSTKPKPILKSAIKDSPLKVQKVKFDLGNPFKKSSINMMTIIEEAERRHAALPIGGPKRPDWANMKIPKAPEEPDTTSSIPTEIQKPKVRKFFKSPRLTLKKT